MCQKAEIKKGEKRTLKSNEHTASLTSRTPEDAHNGDEYVTIDQLRHLVRLIDQSDVAEIEVKYGENHTRLLLRKARHLVDNVANGKTTAVREEVADLIAPEPYMITAPMVGIFQSWSTSKDKPLVAIGDILKERQHIGVIRSLNIPNEVETPVAGRVVNLLVEDGQCIEYGQLLMTIDRQ